MGLVQDKVAIITGAGANIGEACAKMLAAQGAKVVVADINVVGAERVAGEIVSGGGTAFAHAVNLGDEASIVALVAAVMERHGQIDILHNNAANTGAAQMTRDGALTAMEAEVWDAAFDINTRGTMLMTKHVAPHMAAGGGGSIINTSSGASLRGDLFRVAYASSKAAINVLTEYVAAQYGKQGIRCNVVSPGLVVTENTEMNQGHNLDLYLAHHLTPRLGRPDDLAAMVALLASDDGKFITAQIIPVDGGISTHFPHVAETRGGVDAYKPVKN